MNLGLSSLFAATTGGGGIGDDPPDPPPGGTTALPTGLFVGESNLARKVKSIYVGVGDVARKVKAGYVGIGGAARKFYSDALTEVPYGTTPRNLALTILGREVAAPSDVTAVVDAVSNTIKNGKINNLVLGDYFGLASINIAAGYSAGGAFSASLANIPGGRGRNLDFVLVAKNPYLNRNGNTSPHVVFQSRNVLSAMTSLYQGGHYMNSLDTNVGGYNASKGRAFVNARVYQALAASGVPVGEPTKIIRLKRYVASGGSGATGPNLFISEGVFLPTEYEMFGVRTFSHATYEASYQAHFSYYGTAASRIKYKADGVAVLYWEASPNSSYTNMFCCVNTNGSAHYNSAYAELGIAPAFAVGWQTSGGGGGAVSGAGGIGITTGLGLL